MNARHRALDYVLWTLALSWPLGVFAQTSLYGVSIFTVLTLVLFALTIPDVVAERSPPARPSCLSGIWPTISCCSCRRSSR